MDVFWEEGRWNRGSFLYNQVGFSDQSVQYSKKDMDSADQIELISSLTSSFVNLTESRVTWEERISEELSGSGWPVGVSVSVSVGVTGGTSLGLSWLYYIRCEPWPTVGGSVHWT